MARQRKPSSPQEELAQLEERRQELIAQLRSDAENTLKQALDDFNKLDLGVAYELRARDRVREKGRVQKRVVAKKGSSAGNPDRLCPICGFATIPPHDGRAHRSQSPKRPFSAGELTERGMNAAS